MALGDAFSSNLPTPEAGRICKALRLASPVTDANNLRGAEVEGEARPGLAFKKRYLPLNLGANAAGTDPRAGD